MQSGKQTHQKFVFHFCKRLLWSIIDREINDIYLQEMWYLLSNMHHWFLSTITAGAPEPEQSQSYRQSLSPDFYVEKFWRLICAFFISVSFHKDAEFICPRTCICYLQIISTTQSRKTAICQTQTTWLDKRLKRLDLSSPVEICKTTSGRDKQNEDCNWDLTGRREPFKRVLEIIKTLARRLHRQRWESLSASFSTRLSSWYFVF